MMIAKALFATATLSVGAAALAAAGPLEVTSTAMVEAKAARPDGTTGVALVPARRVVPGDRVVFVVRYRNTSTQPLSDIVIANPVPASLLYRAPAENSPAPEVSADGRSFAPLAALRLTDPAGGPRAATADDVRHLRWRLARPLTPGAQGQFAYRAIVK